MSAVRDRILEAVDNDDITWEYKGTLTYYRWWLTETEYRTLTATERRHLKAMLKDGELVSRHGWRFGIGGIERPMPAPQPRKGDG